MTLKRLRQIDITSENHKLVFELQFYNGKSINPKSMNIIKDVFNGFFSLTKSYLFQKGL